MNNQPLTTKFLNARNIISFTFAMMFALINVQAQTTYTRTISVEFASSPSDEVNIAPLKYNKKIAYSLTIDDNHKDIWDVAYPLITGLPVTANDVVAGGTNYGSGMEYQKVGGFNSNDGCSNLVPFKLGLAVNAAYVGQNSTFIDWTQLKTMYQAGWDILNHSYTHDDEEPIDFNEEIVVNSEVINTKLKEEDNTINFYPRHFVIPTNVPLYHPETPNYGMVATYGNIYGFTGNANDGYWKVDGDISAINDNLQLLRTSVPDGDISLAGVTSKFDQLAGLALAHPLWYNEYTHAVRADDEASSVPGISNLGFNMLKGYMEHIETNYSDIVWVAGIQEVEEYLYTRNNAVITNKTLSGNTLTFAIELGAAQPDQRYFDLSILVGSGIVSVSVDAGDDVTWNAETGLINLVLASENSLAQTLIINEFMASNTQTNADEAGEFEDWVEIYNPGNTAINMAGMYFTDDLTIPNLWQIPSGSIETIIQPGGFKIFWLDKDTNQGVLHVNAKLSASGEQIGLYSSNLQLIDELTYTDQSTDISYGRTADGSNEWTFYTTPTPGMTNVQNTQDGHFVTTWKTNNPGTSSNTSITIPTHPGSVYSYDIDWNNDGVFDVFGVDGSMTHNFETAGTYTIRIRGDFPRIYFNNQGDREKLLSVDQWGNQVWTSMEGAFFGCTNLNGLMSDVPNLSSVTDMGGMFWSATSFNQPLNEWDVSHVTNMYCLFDNAASFNQPLDAWNVSNVTNMWGMFLMASAFNNPIDAWDVSQVVDMYGMFLYADAFNQPLNSWNVENVTNMRDMFHKAYAFNQPLDNWNVSKVTTMRSMFFFATAFNGELNNWGESLSNVVDMSKMFIGASSFNQPINEWNVTSVTNMKSMFCGAASFNQNLGSWNLMSSPDMWYMLDNTALSAANYDSTLIGWYDQINWDAPPSDLILGAKGLKYCLSKMQRFEFANNLGWNFLGDQLDCSNSKPSCTKLYYPSNGAVVANTDLILTWEAASNALGYHLSIGTTPNGTEIIDVDLDNVNSYSFLTAEDNQTYYVSVTPYNQNGAAIGCSEDIFTTDSNDAPATSTGIAIYNCPLGVNVTTNNESAICIWSTPSVITTCSTAPVTVSQTGLPSGSNFSVGSYTITYSAEDICNNIADCSFVVNVIYTEACGAIDGFIKLGDFNNHGYYVSDSMTWKEGKVLAENTGGHLVSITSQEENSFLKNLVDDNNYFIGFNDAQEEGVGQWANNEDVTINLSTANTSDGDYAVFNYWDGSWGLSNTQAIIRPFILEMVCNTTNSSITISCPENINIQSTTNSAVVNWQPTTATTTCPTSSDVTISQTVGLPSGSIFDVGTHAISYQATDECDNNQSCSFSLNVTTEVTSQDCDPIDGFTMLGQYNGHAYYLSNTIDTWDQASILAENIGGYLTSITTQEENDFITGELNGTMALIGFSDHTSEGTGQWANGEPTTIDMSYDNNSNNDYAVINFWEGTWQYVNQYVQKKFILEMDCNGTNNGSITLSCPEAINVATTNSAAIINWAPPVVSTTCPTSSDVTISQTVGQPSGSSFEIGAYTITYSGEDGCANMGTCSFTVTLSTENTATIPCGEIDGFTKIGDYNNHAYYVSNNTAPWQAAIIAADNAGGHLTSITTQAENDFLTDNIGNNLYFIGFTDADDTKKWANGEPVSIDLSNNTSENGDYAVLNFWDGSWDLGYSAGVYKQFIMEKGCSDTDGAVQITCPDDMTATIEYEANDVFVVWDSPTASTTCSLNNSVAINPLGAQASLTSGTHTIEYTATDGCDNEATCSFTIEVTVENLENSALTLSGCTDLSVITTNGQQGAVVSWPAPTATSTCATGSVAVVQTAGSGNGNLLGAGTHVIEYTATDGCDNEATCSFTVTVTGGNGSECGDINGFTKMEQYASHYYYISNDLKNWSDAKNIASLYNGYLASITTQSENDFLKNQLHEIGTMVFIGLHGDATSLEWDNGETFSLDLSDGTGGGYGVMNFWDGHWDVNYGDAVEKQFIMEINDCDINNPIPASSSFLSLRLYPNPGSNTINLDVIAYKDEEIHATVLNAQGQVAFSSTHQFVKGQNVVELDIQDLPEGLYYLNLRSKRMSVFKRFIKLAYKKPE